MAPRTSRIRPAVFVTTAAQAAARDDAAIAGQTPSRALMQRAGAAAATEIASRYRYRLSQGALIFAGPGNNGGDAWVVAGALSASGVQVRVVEPVRARTPDTCAERAVAEPLVELVGDGTELESVAAGEQLIVDGLLGTGGTGAPRGAIRDAIDVINGLRRHGATVVSLDVPSGLDASTGDGSAVVTADVTIAFATVKRGLLLARAQAGTIIVVDIGLATFAEIDDGAPMLVDGSWLSHVLPELPLDAHKGTRKRLAVVGGAGGMAGAAVLAARGAARAGIGMVKLVVAPESVRAVQEAEPVALAMPWPSDDATLMRDVSEWADVIALGPGLGNRPETRRLIERILEAWRGPVVLDADALNVYAGDADSLAAVLDGRRALLTPHPAELARLAGLSVADVLAERFELTRRFAARINATVLLKGVPTVVSSPDEQQLVSARGSPALATAGSGDVLTGIAATLLAQLDEPIIAGAAAAWAHGRAAELAHGDPDAMPRGARGITLDDVIAALPGAWQTAPPPRYPVLLELPRISG